MVLEACVIMYRVYVNSILTNSRSVDNSEYSRNGDYSPSRLAAQLDAAQHLFSLKRRANVETTVSLMVSAGDCPRPLVSLSTDHRRVLAEIGQVVPKGENHFGAALRIAQIVLKARPNPNQRQRIVVFVASPLGKESGEDLGLVGKQLRKNGVAVDVVTVAGKDFQDIHVLERFIDAVNVGAEVDDGDRQSRLLEVHPGESVLESVSLHLLNHNQSGLSPSADFDDADMDPELAMALKMSLEEEQARQASTAAGEGKNVDDNDDNDVDMEDPELAKAIAMSLEKN